MVATSRSWSSGDRRAESAQFDIGVASKGIVSHTGRGREQRFRGDGTRGRMLLTYRKRMRVVGKNRPICAIHALGEIVLFQSNCL